ncbi:MAG: L-threonylcarbamoyladenylate synthase, partial [Bacteroidales bacterium]
MELLRVIEHNINERHIDQAVDALRDGAIIIYPTDSLYAFGCNALNNSAVERLCRLKGLNSDKTNLSIICHDISQVAEYARFDNRAFKIMKDNLPGAFTFIFPASNKLPKAFKGRKTVGIRIPDNQIALALVEQLGNPIMTTSVKTDDIDYAINPELMAEFYEDDVAVVIDGGEGNI